MEYKIKKLSLVIVTAIIASCSSSDDSSSGTGYVQMYNASANSPTIYLEIDGVVRTGAGFGAVTTRHNYNDDTYSLNYLYINDNNDYLSILDADEDLIIKNDEKSLKLISGDFNQPRIDEFRIEEYEEEDKFQISAINTISENTEYDIYLAKEDYAFVDAELITSSSFLSLPEFTEKEEGQYTFYVTESGSDEIIFKSQMVDFDDEESFVVMLRPSFSAEAGGIVLDIVSDGSSVYSLSHIDAKSQMRFYNSIDDYSEVSFNAVSTQQSFTTEQVQNDTATSYTTVDAGTFTISMLDSNNNPIVNNYVEAVTKNVSLLSIFYQHTNNYPAMISISEDLTPNEITHSVQVVNLIDTSPFDTEVDEIDIYFTEGNETIDDTTSYLKDIDSFDSKMIYLDSQKYDITVTFEANDQTISIMQLADVDFSNKGNYVLITRLNC